MTARDLFGRRIFILMLFAWLNNSHCDPLPIRLLQYPLEYIVCQIDLCWWNVGCSVLRAQLGAPNDQYVESNHYSCIAFVFNQCCAFIKPHTSRRLIVWNLRFRLKNLNAETTCGSTDAYKTLSSYIPLHIREVDCGRMPTRYTITDSDHSSRYPGEHCIRTHWSHSRLSTCCRLDSSWIHPLEYIVYQMIQRFLSALPTPISRYRGASLSVKGKSIKLVYNDL